MICERTETVDIRRQFENAFRRRAFDFARIAPNPNRRRRGILIFVFDKCLRQLDPSVRRGVSGLVHKAPSPVFARDTEIGVKPRDPFDILRRDVAVVEVEEKTNPVFFRFVLRNERAVNDVEAELCERFPTRNRFVRRRPTADVRSRSAT